MSMSPCCILKLRVHAACQFCMSLPASDIFPPYNTYSSNLWFSVHNTATNDISPLYNTPASMTRRYIIHRRVWLAAI
jgi:hypothetical protein